MERIVCFEPVLPPEAKILILGTVPSVKSLETGFYYGHPQNAFWRILSEVFGTERPVTIPQKIGLLTDNGIALWDTVNSCEREGSLDSAIRDAVPNAYALVRERCPGIRRVLLNGKTAANLFTRYRDGAFANAEILVMPSTSPAYTLSYEKKLAVWREALRFTEE